MMNLIIIVIINNLPNIYNLFYMETQNIFTLDEVYQIAIQYKQRGEHVNLTQLLVTLENYALTEDDFDKKLSIFQYTGHIYRLLPNYHKSAELYFKALEMQPKEHIFIDLIQNYLISHQYDEAIRWADKADHLYNNVIFRQLRSSAMVNLCTPYLERKQFESCVSILRRYSEPDDVVLATTVTSVKNYCSIEKLNYQEVQTTGQKNVIYRPDVFNGRKISSSKNIEMAKIPVYICEIPHATLLAGSTIVLAGNKQFILDDTFFIFDRRRFLLDTHTKEVTKGYSALVNGIAVHARRGDSLDIDFAVYFGGTYSFNFYHWVIEHLPTFWVINQLPQYRDLPILVDEGSIKHPNMLAMLKQVNITNREIIPVKAGHAYNINKLIVISKLAHVSPSVRDELKPTDVIIHREAVEFLRQIFFMPTQSKPNRLIFLGRKSSVAARISNQEEIQSVFSDYGFEIVYPEELSLEQSIELFSQAKIIAGATGAAQQFSI